GWVDNTTLKRAERAGLSIHEALHGHSSSSLLEALGDRLVTGPTGTNVMDMVLVLVAGDPSWTPVDSPAN
ncbi:MAG TPA: MOFRL family protein, partial [Gammaproteobacteria bacterium]|nr:MOFRL family protein [Gammaproteobacteria bacterium]